MKTLNGQMPNQQSDLNGSAPDNHVVALLLIDVINDFQFPEGERLLENEELIAAKIEGREVVAQQSSSKPAPVVDIMDALRKSLATRRKPVASEARPASKGKLKNQR